ncbi:hypothetical protein ACFQX6_42110 [Streptosporangium lutulentum]
MREKNLRAVRVALVVRQDRKAFDAGPGTVPAGPRSVRRGAGAVLARPRGYPIRVGAARGGPGGRGPAGRRVTGTAFHGSGTASCPGTISDA